MVSENNEYIEPDVSGNEDIENVANVPENEETAFDVSVSGGDSASPGSGTEAGVQVIDYTEILSDVSAGLDNLNLLCGLILFMLVATWTDRHFASIVKKFTGKGREM